MDLSVFSVKVQRSGLCRLERPPFKRFVICVMTWKLSSHSGSDLFLSNRGKAISRKMFWVLIKQYACAAGIDKSVKPHMLRHCFATHLLAGALTFERFRNDGHADISTTQIYASVEQDVNGGAHILPSSESESGLAFSERSSVALFLFLAK